MKKKTLLAAIILLLISTRVHGQELRIMVDNNYIYSQDQPIIKDGRTLLPIRELAQALGARLSWKPENKSLQISRQEQVLELRVGSSKVLVDGQVFQMDQPVSLIGGRTMVPLRELGQLMGSRIEWLEDKRTIMIDSDSYRPYKNNSYWSHDDFAASRLIRPILEELRGQALREGLGSREEELKGGRVLTIDSGYGSLSLDLEDRAYYNPYGGLVALVVDQRKDLGQDFLRAIKVGDRLEDSLDKFPRMGESNLDLEEGPDQILYCFKEGQKIYRGHRSLDLLSYSIESLDGGGETSRLLLFFQEDRLVRIELYP